MWAHEIRKHVAEPSSSSLHPVFLHQVYEGRDVMTSLKAARSNVQKAIQGERGKLVVAGAK